MNVKHGDRKGPPIPIAPPSPLLYTGFAAQRSIVVAREEG